METRSVEDEAAWLRARLQCGELAEARLRLAAYCGHLASRSIVEVGPAEADTSDITGLIRWSRELAEFSSEVWVASLLPIAADELVRWAQSTLRPTALVGAPAEAVEAARTWLQCPCPLHRRTADEAAARAREAATAGADSMSMAHGAAVFCASLLKRPPDPSGLRCSPFAVGAPMEARIRMELGAMEWLLGYPVPPPAQGSRSRAVPADEAPPTDWIQVRSVESGLGCDAEPSCASPIRVNAVGQHFDLWICAEHALDLGRRLSTAATRISPTAGPPNAPGGSRPGEPARRGEA